MKRKTFDELKKENDEKLWKLRETCEHDKITVKVDTSCCGRGSLYGHIDIRCVWCNDYIQIRDFPPGKERDKFIGFIKKGIITFDFNSEKDIFEMESARKFLNGDDIRFCSAANDKKIIYNMLKEARQ